VHLDFRSPHAPDFLTRCYPRKRGKWISNMMTESPRKTQPRCEVSPGWNGLLLTLRVAERPEDEPEPFRLWLGPGVLVTACAEPEPPELGLQCQLLQESLGQGTGPASCGTLATSIISSMTTLTSDSVASLSDLTFALKGQLQQTALAAGPKQPVSSSDLNALRRALMPLRYAAITMRRYEVPERDALATVLRFADHPGQSLFSDTDRYDLSEAAATQDALVASLDATLAAGEALQNELMAHLTWQQGEHSFRLTVLGSVLSILGFFSISVDVLDFVARRRDAVEQADAVATRGT